MANRRYILKNKRLSQELEDIIITMIFEGKPTSEIVEATGLYKSKINYYRRKLGQTI